MSGIPVWLWCLAGGLAAWFIIVVLFLVFWHHAFLLRKWYEPRPEARRSTYEHERT